jgi:uncharacterized protein (DUF1786 family)
MSRGKILAIDIGGGTQDILIYDPDKPLENCYKLVLPSPTVMIAQQIREVTARQLPLYLSGYLMGGGACKKAVKEHLQAGLKVYADIEAAKTFDDNLEKVKSLGVIIGSEAPVEAVEVKTGDLCREALAGSLARFGVELPIRWAVAVQDHGEAMGKSNRLFRFEHWRNFIIGEGKLEQLAYTQIPSYLTRMQAVQNQMFQSQIVETLLMDTGPAAVWGSLEDPVVEAQREKGVIIVKVGNQHTFGVLLQGERVWGLFEHHTRQLASEELAEWVNSLLQGKLTNEQIFQSGGHGCFIHPEYIPFSSTTLVVLVGPQRAKVAENGWYQAAPGGDMMLTGCFGLVKAACEVWV